jgi:hypothetical protein
VVEIDFLIPFFVVVIEHPHVGFNVVPVALQFVEDFPLFDFLFLVAVRAREVAIGGYAAMGLDDRVYILVNVKLLKYRFETLLTLTLCCALPNCFYCPQYFRNAIANVLHFECNYVIPFALASERGSQS